MMSIKDRHFDPLPYNVSLEELVPENNFYRKVAPKLFLSKKLMITNGYLYTKSAVTPLITIQWAKAFLD